MDGPNSALAAKAEVVLELKAITLAVVRIQILDIMELALRGRIVLIASHVPHTLDCRGSLPSAYPLSSLLPILSIILFLKIEHLFYLVLLNRRFNTGLFAAQKNRPHRLQLFAILLQKRL